MLVEPTTTIQKIKEMIKKEGIPVDRQDLISDFGGTLDNDKTLRDMFEGSAVDLKFLYCRRC